MKLTQNSINNLINYVKNNEVVYQSYGELMEISNDENSDNRESLLSDFILASGVEVYNKGSMFIHDDFEDLDNWATNEDTLFLLELNGTLICIPTKCAVENNIIAA